MGDMGDVFEANVRARLESTFGRAVATMIIASASVAANVSTMGIGRDEYLKLCEEICRDQRVVDMWGSSGAADTLRTWQAAA